MKGLAPASHRCGGAYSGSSSSWMAPATWSAYLGNLRSVLTCGGWLVPAGCYDDEDGDLRRSGQNNRAYYYRPLGDTKPYVHTPTYAASSFLATSTPVHMKKAMAKSQGAA